MGTKTQKTSGQADLSQKRYTNEEKKRISSNARKIKRILVCLLQYFEIMELGYKAVDERHGAIAYDYFHKAGGILKKISVLAEDYDGQPHTTLEIEADLGELRGRARKCNAFAARLGITPTELLNKQMRGVLPC